MPFPLDCGVVQITCTVRLNGPCPIRNPSCVFSKQNQSWSSFGAAVGAMAIEELRNFMGRHFICFAGRASASVYNENDTSSVGVCLSLPWQELFTRFFPRGLVVWHVVNGFMMLVHHRSYCSGAVSLTLYGRFCWFNARIHFLMKLTWIMQFRRLNWNHFIVV